MWAVERIRPNKELKVSYRQGNAERLGGKIYVDRVGLEGLVCLLTIARFMQRRDCVEKGIVKAQVSPHLIRRRKLSIGRNSPPG
jgi:hypothetical protein